MKTVFVKDRFLEAIPRKIIQPKLDELSSTERGWAITETDLDHRLKQISKSLGEVYQKTLMIDLKPNSMRKEVSLFQVKNIYGYSYDDWTPLCLELRTIYDDFGVKNSDQKKQNVEVDLEKYEDRIYEFLYIRKGLKSGTLNWGMTGSVNAPLLWPGALRFFMNNCIKVPK